MQVILYRFTYSYLEYEKELMIREIKTLFPNTILNITKKEILLDDFDKSDIPKLKRLTYIASYTIDNVLHYTYQYKMENSATNAKTINRQSTRYSSHGLHEYRGKYNPQIVRSLINVMGFDNSSIVLDPFCGSGTTMLECQHMGIRSTGMDINPMAAFIANTKINSLYINMNDVRDVLRKVSKKFQDLDSITSLEETDRLIYLKKWIPEETLKIMECILSVLKDEPVEISDFYKIITSDLIRDYSNQEPADLRIRKRISPYPVQPFIEAFEQNAIKYINLIAEAQRKVDLKSEKNYAIVGDVKVTSTNNKFTGAITSPPYATALPYIDTQRISLVWLGLCQPTEIMKLESTLIGSREFYSTEKKKWLSSLENNTDNLPNEIYQLIMHIKDSLAEKDGFRKQAMPTLLYRYFSDMKNMFLNVYSMLIEDGSFALVVGHNKTTIGGTTYNIDTPKLLSVLAVECGWTISELTQLQTYKRYGINSKNSINIETLIIVRK
jgi:site-specific DNA-methyltransferase (cytosine-N4-specific)